MGAHIAFMRAADTARCGPPLVNRRARQVPVNSLSQSSARILHGVTSRVRPRLLRALDARGRSVSRQGVPHQHLAVGYALRPIHDSSCVVYGVVLRLAAVASLFELIKSWTNPAIYYAADCRRGGVMMASKP